MKRTWKNNFLMDVVNMTCHVSNFVLVRHILKKNPHELYKGRKSNNSHLHFFRSKCFVLNKGKNNVEKLDTKSDEGIFIGYSISSKDYKIFNKITLTIVELIHAAFDETNPSKEDTFIYIGEDDASNDINNNDERIEQDNMHHEDEVAQIKNKE